MHHPNVALRRGPALAALLVAGAVAGTLDASFITIAYVLPGRITLLRLFQGIAKAVLGPAAYQGGLATALLGLAMHYFVALSWAALFAFAARSGWLRRQIAALPGALLAGAVYGVVIFGVMTFIVLPLTRATRGPLFTFNFYLQLAAHILIIGIPIVLVVRALAQAAQMRPSPAISTSPSPQ